MRPARHRWGAVAAFVMAVAATATDRVHAETADPDAAIAAAESLYRQREAAPALAAFEAIVARDPPNAFAWLRIGNLHQQAGRDEAALVAYRQASLGAPTDTRTAQARAKALLNLALVHVAQASRAIDELDAMNAVALRSERNDAARQVGAQRHRAERAATAPDAAATRPAPASTTTDAARPPFEPYTVDRWTGQPRRSPTRPASARPSVAEPLTETPLPPAPRADVLRGGVDRERAR